MISPTHLTTLGYSIVPTGPDKWPTVPGGWKRYQNHIATPQEMASWFPSYGVAIICGKVSGNLEVIDFDLKNDPTGTLFDEFMQMVMDNMPEIAGTLVVAESRSKGRHIYYRCDVIEGNRKLASRPADEHELVHNPNLKLYGLIETRGEGGIIVCAPSPGYTWLQGDLSTVPTIPVDERDELLNIARSFNSYITPPDHNFTSVPQEAGYSLTPWADYDQRGDILALLKAHGYTILKQNGDNIRLRRPGKSVAISGDFNVVKRWFTLFTTSTEFEAQKAYRPSAVLCKLECNDNWQKLYDRLVSEGYGTKVPAMAKEVVRALNKGKLPDVAVEDIGTITDQYNKSKGNKIEKFWFITMNKDGDLFPDIDKVKLAKFLKELGFFLYYHDQEVATYDLVQVENNMVSYSAESEIIQAIKDYINSLPERFDGIWRNDLMNLFAKNTNMVHEPRWIKFFLEKLHRQGKTFLKDTKSVCYLPYNNGIVQIEADGARLLKYSELNRLIWKSAIIKRSIRLIDDFSGDCEYSDFIKFISKDSNPELWIERKLSAYSITGYLIHGYKDRINPKAVILMEQCDDPTKGGGTGKGMFLQAINQMVKVAFKTGKSFDPANTFAFQDITPYTRVINISDTSRKFRIEDYNSLITDALKTERKNRDAVVLTYEESPKVAIDMNYTITEVEDSALRRIVTFEVSDHFSRTHRPVDEFGHALFYDWDPEEFNRFDNLMIQCVRLYLSAGFVEVKMSEGGKFKTIKQRCGESFAEWFQDWIKSPKSKEHTRSSDLYDEFINNYHNDSKPYDKVSFGRNIAFSCKRSGLKLCEKRLSEPKRPKVFWVEDDSLKEEAPF